MAMLSTLGMFSEGSSGSSRLVKGKNRVDFSVGLATLLRLGQSG